MSTNQKSVRAVFTNQKPTCKQEADLASEQCLESPEDQHGEEGRGVAASVPLQLVVITQSEDLLKCWTLLLDSLLDVLQGNNEEHK